MDEYQPTEFRRAAPRARSYLTGRVLVRRERGRWRRPVTFETVVEMNSVSLAGVAFRAPASLALDIDDEAVLCVGIHEAPVRIRRREGQLNDTTYYGAEFMAMDDGMRAELAAEVQNNNTAAWAR